MALSLWTRKEHIPRSQRSSPLSTMPLSSRSQARPILISRLRITSPMIRPQRSRSFTPPGRYGLELYYNDVLSRSGDSSINFFAEVFGQVRDSVFERKPREGNIVTT